MAPTLSLDRRQKEVVVVKQLVHCFGTLGCCCALVRFLPPTPPSTEANLLRPAPEDFLKDEQELCSNAGWPSVVVIVAVVVVLADSAPLVAIGSEGQSSRREEMERLLMGGGWCTWGVGWA